MPSKQSRRRFLATGGLTSAVAIAGCLGRRTLAPATERSDTTPQPTNTPESTPVPAADRDRYSEDDREYRGDLLHDWSGWTAHSGTVAETTETAFVGTTSMLLEDEDGSAVRCSYDLGDGSIDLRDRGLCAAIRWDRPNFGVAFKLVLEDSRGKRVEAAANALGSHAESADDWIMSEFGIAAELDDEPIDLGDVTRLTLSFYNGRDASARIYVDNFRLIPYERRTGAVLFTADDGRQSQLSVMRAVLDEYDYPSTHFNMSTGRELHMTEEEQLDLAGQPGCFVSPHPQRPTPLPEMTDSDSHATIKREYEYFASELGLGHDHARFMSWPYGRHDTSTVVQAREFHDLCFAGVHRATAGWRSAAPMSVARCSFDSLADLENSLEIAQRYGRVLIPQFHTFYPDEPTGGTNATPDDFRAFVESVAAHDVDVISMDEYAATHEA
jgi:hypothetical protein